MAELKLIGDLGRCRKVWLDSDWMPMRLTGLPSSITQCFACLYGLGVKWAQIGRRHPGRSVQRPSRFKRVEHDKKNPHDGIECAPCLYKLGYGYKRISDTIGVSTTGALSHLNRVGVYDSAATVSRRKVFGRLRTMHNRAEIKCNHSDMRKGWLSKAIKPDGVSDYQWSRDTDPVASRKFYSDYYQRNKDAHRARMGAWKAKNPDKVKKSAKRCRDKPEQKVKKRAYAKAYKANNPDRFKYRNNSPHSKAMSNIRARVRNIMKTGGGRMPTGGGLVGCSGSDLRDYLESMFTKGMAWSNYGTFWHVDHVIPLSMFDATSISQMMKANHFTNLQPMKASENLSKSNKLTDCQQRLML